VRTALVVWLILRGLRWLLWLLAGAYYVEVALHQAAHIDSTGQLLNSTNFWMFGLPVAAIFISFLELAAREKAGLDRPAAGRDWLGRPRQGWLTGQH
jgi:hypothetical protein